MRSLSMILMVLCSCSYEYVYNTTMAPDGGEGKELDAGRGNDGAVGDNPDAASEEPPDAGWVELEDARAPDTPDAAVADTSSMPDAGEDADLDPGLGQCEPCTVREECREGFECEAVIWGDRSCLEYVEFGEECDGSRELMRRRAPSGPASAAICVPYGMTCVDWLLKYGP